MGYMGSGKSTIGKHLAEVLNYNFIDLDDYISGKENSSVTSIFNTKGEIYFRKKEAYYLNEIVSTSGNIVLALGGGTPCYGNNLQLIKANASCVSFYLKLTIPQLVKRLFTEKAARPLIAHVKDSDELQEYIGKHMFERSAYYAQADYSINTGELSIDEGVEAIVLKLI